MMHGKRRRICAFLQNKPNRAESGGKSARGGLKDVFGAENDAESARSEALAGNVRLSGRDAGDSRTGIGSVMVFVVSLALCLAMGPAARRAGSTELQRSVDYRRLYADGHALFQAGRFAESLELLRLGALLSSDPMFDIIIGRDYEALGDFDKALDAYLRAHYMVPGRLYPLVRLMRLQVRSGQDTQALQTARTLLDLPVNPRHRTMPRLHDEAEATRDSLAALIDIYDYEGRE